MPPLPEDQPPRTLALIGLAVAQCFGSFGQLTMATLAGIVGTLLTPSMEVATLPVAAGIIGVATAAWPLAALRSRFGSRAVFVGALLWAALGTALAAYAISIESFALFCVAMFMLGNNMAVIAQYRFVAAAMVPPGRVSRAVSGVMIGTLLAAIIAPSLAIEFRALFDADFAGSFAVLVFAYLATAVIVGFLPLPETSIGTHADDAAPPLRDTLGRAPIQLAILAAAGGYGVMSLIMTATPISMHVMDQHSAEVTAGVIRAHLLAMFAPSLFSGWLIAKLGVSRMLAFGIVLNLACIGIAISGNEIWHYRAALILLGAGWNFLFVGGTTLLAVSCTKGESASIQGFNDFVMFGAMGIAALTAGGLLDNFGWQWTNLTALLGLGLIGVALLRASVK